MQEKSYTDPGVVEDLNLFYRLHRKKDQGAGKWLENQRARWLRRQKLS